MRHIGRRRLFQILETLFNTIPNTNYSLSSIEHRQIFMNNVSQFYRIYNEREENNDERIIFTELLTEIIERQTQFQIEDIRVNLDREMRRESGRLDQLVRPLSEEQMIRNNTKVAKFELHIHRYLERIFDLENQ